MRTQFFIAEGALKRAGEKARALGLSGKAAVVSDDNVYPLWGKRLSNSLIMAGFDVVPVVFPHGEPNKTAGTYVYLLNRLAEAGFSRADTVFSLGGGVTGDLAGFAAATCLRGLNLVHAPTSLLAQVDSAVGGKTGVDLPSGKNAAGAFYMPRLVLFDLDTLYTLPRAEILNGVAEEVKYAAILGAPCYTGSRKRRCRPASSFPSPPISSRSS